MGLGRRLGATAALGIGTLGYSYLEATRRFVVREVTAPVLPAGHEPIRVLHLSDIHLVPTQLPKREWLNSLAELEPDLVVDTGDNLAHPDSVAPLVGGLAKLLNVPGAFVFGSNDYFSPKLKNPASYLRGGTGVDREGDWERERDLPFDALRAAFTRQGWLDLNNDRGELTVKGTRIAFTGVDDPHLRLDRLDHQPADLTADLRIGVAHAPYLRVLDSFNAAGNELILAGHTHGGQLQVPGFGALVTNCDIDRRRANGLHQHRTPGHDASWLHVSAGCGTSPYTPFRFSCRPEATVVTLTG
ncbi:metallophosphoesterase [Aeromicrobium flavum]|uniref:Metallophosphoesterase n=1 Tax=Aeromicrobium flavum TaxID=416568 RepID=A0A512HTY4_9ACTN|nr:metallophosphoesterase [Aeromicrobium flavum]GEO88912.1 metallophosphoesterase [Aeromicrobium flavum]